MNPRVSAIAVVLLAGMGLTPVRAQDSAPTISLAGQVVMRIRTGAGGYTAEQRAEAVRERLVPILSMENLTPDDVAIRQTRPNQDAHIFVRDRLLITVDRTLTQANGGGDPYTLASAWAEKLRMVLPQVKGPQNRRGL